MKRRIKESKNIFPCTVYMENQDYDEAYYYLDTPEYGLSWRSFDDVEQEDVENYKYIIKNTADLRKAIDDLEEDFIYGYGAKYFKLSGNYMEDLLNRGKTLVHVSNVDSRDTVFIIKVKPVQDIELATVVRESANDYIRIVEDGVTAIEEEAFWGSGATKIIIPDSVTTIGERAFKDCMRLNKINIPESVTSIGKCAFLNCSRLPSIEIPSSVTSIEAFTFSQCHKLKSIEIPNSVTSIGAFAFETCHKLESIEIPKSVTYIGPGAFEGCINLQSINIPKGVTTIKKETFFSCHKLTEVIIPDSVTSIENDAFYGCESLTTINYTGTRDQWNAIEKDPTWREECPQNMVINYNYQESSTFDESSVELALAESFEKTIRNLQKEGLFENVSSFDLNFNGKGINIKLNESQPGNRNASFKKRSNLKENESKAPLTDMVLDHMSQDGVLYDNWPYCCIDSAKFYDEVSENTGLDYDDVKDYYWDLVPDDLEIEDKLIELGSENYLLKKYGTLENLQKILDSDEGAENVYNDLGRFDLSDYAYEAWADAIDTATSYIESRNHGYDEYYDED